MGIYLTVCVFSVLIYFTQGKTTAKVEEEFITTQGVMSTKELPVERTTERLQPEEVIVSDRDNATTKKELEPKSTVSPFKPFEEDHNPDLVVIRECLDKKNNLKRPHPPAIDCEDSLGAEPCSILFGISNAQAELNRDISQNYKISAKCFDPNFAMAAKQCSSACATCCKLPQYKCDDRLGTKCVLMKILKMCKHPGTFHIAISECAQSCGLCDKPGASGVPCPDIADDCENLHTFLDCEDPYMKQNCKRKCQLVDCEKETEKLFPNVTNGSESVCKDDRINCAIVFHRCNDPNYGFAIRHDCKKTCGLC